MVTLNVHQENITWVKKAAGIYLIAVGVMVALNFILGPFHPSGFDVMMAWEYAARLAS